MLSPEFNALAGAVNLIGCVSYARGVLAGKNKPNRVGWSLWAIAPLIAFAAQLSQGVSWPALMTLSSGLGPLTVLLCSFVAKKAYWRLRPFDWACGGLSIVALILWAITGEGNVAIVFSICADILACLPTLRKSFTHPHTESSVTFWAGVVGVTITLFTIQHWDIATSAFPIYLLAANLVIALTINVRAHMLPEKVPAEA
jgi:hypothetical protein